MIKTLTCIECPVGCEIRVETENGEVKSVQGNSCPRGKMYAESLGTAIEENAGYVSAIAKC